MRLSQALLLLLLGAWAIPGGLGDQAVLTATAPQMDDEERYSVHMPAHLRCDACKAVAYQMWKHLSEAEAKLHSPESRGQRELSESVYTDILDRSCSQSWQGCFPLGRSSSGHLSSANVHEAVHCAELHNTLAGPSLMLHLSAPCCLQLWGPGSEPGEALHRPRAKHGARVTHQRDGHRRPLAHQAHQDMFAVPGGAWGRPAL